MRYVELHTSIKMTTRIVSRLILVFLAAGCGGSTAAPPAPQQIPEPVEVSWETLPASFDDRMYFSEVTLPDASAVLQALVKHGFRMKNAWIGHGTCFPVNIAVKTLIIELVDDDPEIVDEGFRRDYPPNPRCFTRILHYEFTP